MAVNYVMCSAVLTVSFGRPAGDKERMNVPGQTSSVHIEMTYFYYPGNVRFPGEVV